MGAGPTIDGGMTQAEYRELQMEERQFMSQQEEKQMALMQEMEEKRLQREQAEAAKQTRLREKEEEALGALEQAVTEEVDALDKADKDEDKDLVMDFYGSLAKNTPGMGSDGPETGGGLTAGDKSPPSYGGSGSKPSKGKTKTSGGRAGGRPK
jgi:hypothetical protein